MLLFNHFRDPLFFIAMARNYIAVYTKNMLDILKPKLYAG